ncbi:MAG: glycosyltransferase family 4 protein [bacterium]
MSVRIAHITYSYYPIRGGADVYLDNLFKLLANEGYKQEVFQKWEKHIPHYIHSYPPLPRLKGHSFWLVPLFVALQAPRFSKYNLLLIHYSPYFFPLRWHPRTIVISHGVVWDDFPRSTASKIKKWFAKFAFEKSSAFVANDSFFLREMGINISPGEKMFSQVLPSRWLIPNCVDTSFFSPPQERAGMDIIVPRNLYFSRGVHLAIQSFSLIKRDIPSVRLLVAGGLGDPGYALSLFKITDELGLKGRVRFLGHIAWEDMRLLYHRAGICLIPSLFGEGTSLSALEAMASGVATISTSIGGLADLPTVKCQPNPTSLAEKILEIYPKREELGEWQRKQVLENFSLDLWRQAWLNVVKSTLRGGV